ncbi:uncharacterized protein LOC109853675 [Pseudomyrmex gracilis]|uniref:uncharacterized protein LOC109853675 n=1 Tax=Pseudomyrmex gracilis TaxID=219809 RepID=UPI000995725B|nr:uncharacterized protein LOC109853675 [Pseudomyrmex gracilis]
MRLSYLSLAFAVILIVAVMLTPRAKAESDAVGMAFADASPYADASPNAIADPINWKKVKQWVWNKAKNSLVSLGLLAAEKGAEKAVDKILEKTSEENKQQ